MSLFQSGASLEMGPRFYLIGVIGLFYRQNRAKFRYFMKCSADAVVFPREVVTVSPIIQFRSGTAGMVRLKLTVCFYSS